MPIMDTTRGRAQASTISPTIDDEKKSGSATGAGWIDWIRRTTAKAVRAAKQYIIRDWIRAHLLSKWSWAGHVARRPCEAWTWKVTTWRDSEWQELVEETGSCRPLRPSRRRRMKWKQILRSFCQISGHGELASFAYKKKEWSRVVPNFATWASQSLSKSSAM